MSVLTRLRFAALVAPLAYIMVTTLLYGWQPIVAGWPLWAVTLLIVPQMVLGMVFVATPTAQYLSRRLKFA